MKAAVVVALTLLAPRPTPCVNPPENADRKGWQPNTDVVVCLDASVPDADVPAIRTALSNWQVALVGVVKFPIKTNPITDPRPCNYNISRGSIGPPTGDGPAGLTRPHHSPGQGYTFAAETVYSNRVTDYDTLVNVMAHEIGHSLALADCKDCPRGSSVMTTPMQGFSDSGAGRHSPSPCDVRVAGEHTGYVLPGPGGGNGGGGDSALCRFCMIRVCPTERCDIVPALCCPFGQMLTGDVDEVDVCGMMNWFSGPKDDCASSCDAECVKKSNCGDVGCGGPGYCWKCTGNLLDDPPAAPPQPPGKSCGDMGLWGADQKGACDAACGEECRSKQWCETGWCQPWPFYCWKC